MSNRLTIRAVEKSDFDQWLSLWDGYNAFYERTGPTALPSEVTDATWARFFDPAEPVNCVVAEEGGRLVGLVHYIFHRSTSMLNHTCYLQDLFTAEGARGKGAGRALVEAVYERAQAAGAARVYWLTHESNHTARALYDKIAACTGFIQYARKL